MNTTPLEYHVLVEAVAESFERAGLSDMLLIVERRVLHADPARLYDGAEPGHALCRDMTELLLHELREVARMPHLDTPRRKARILWTLDIAGF